MEFIKEYPIEKLKVWEKNPRKNDTAADKLTGMIEEYGFVNPIIIDQHGTIRAGHTRLKAAQKLSKDTVPVLIYDFQNEAQAIGYAIADNKLSEIAEWDFEQLDELMNELEEMDFDTSLTGFEGDELGDEKKFDKTSYIDGVEMKDLKEVFLVPPFSVLNTSQGYWVDRKKEWKKIIGDAGETRAGTLSSGFYESISDGVSIFDPVLAEVINLWFTPKKEGNVIVDCFAGDTVFGYVSGFKGNVFRGIELREEQCKLNNERTKNFDVEYYNDDGRNISKHIEKDSVDLLFSCPPYFDLEVYSDLENDASNQKDYESYLTIIEKALSESVNCLKQNRFAVIVIGDVRNKKSGLYYDLVSDVVRIMGKNGIGLYNNMILYDRIGTAGMLATRYMKGRKIPKVHQNILVFYKGDTKKIRDIFPEIEVMQVESDDMEFQTME
ncbi:MAG: site-specific DNA-methyltransferase [Bacteroidales bacterium]|nr:site-specific DNA-methyltransferase [Bacteroidales bacterium]